MKLKLLRQLFNGARDGVVGVNAFRKSNVAPVLFGYTRCVRGPLSRSHPTGRYTWCMVQAAASDVSFQISRETRGADARERARANRVVLARELRKIRGNTQSHRSPGKATVGT